MSRPFSQGKLKATERRAILHAIESQIQQVITQEVRLVLQEFLEQEVTTKLGRPKRSPRRIDWSCAFCGSDDANQFTRDGHYQRRLETGWGHLDALRVPMVECQRCQHDVVAHFAILEKYRPRVAQRAKLKQRESQRTPKLRALLHQPAAIRLHGLRCGRVVSASWGL